MAYTVYIRLHVAVEENNKIAPKKSFLKHLNVILNPKEAKELIQQKGLQKGNIFQSACQNENEEILSILHECPWMLVCF